MMVASINSNGKISLIIVGLIGLDIFDKIRTQFCRPWQVTQAKRSNATRDPEINHRCDECNIR